jgi:hypothetical protein
MMISKAYVTILNTIQQTGIPLFHKNYPYALLPYVIELNELLDSMLWNKMFK